MLLYSTYNDEELVTFLKHGDLHAFNTLFDRYWQLMYNSAHKNLRDHDRCMDIVHDIFLDLWERRQKLLILNVEAYLKTAVRFKVINQINRSPKVYFFELFDTVAISPLTPDNQLLEKDMLALIQAWVDVLPPKRKKIFVQHFFHHQSTSEISEDLNVSQKTVQNQIGTAINYLYTRLSHLIVLLAALIPF